MKIVTAAEMREIDRLTTEQYGVPSLTLMENAGTAVAEFAQKHFDFGSVCVVCGKGNNGGDGFVAARKLKQAGKKVSVIVLAKSAVELRGDAAAMFKKLKIAPLWVSKERDFEKQRVQQALKAELIVDAILGTGFKPTLKAIAEKAIEAINGLSDSRVVAIDIPSGVDADAVSRDSAFIKSSGIVSFTAPKAALVYGNLTEGPIAIAPIGSPLNLVVSKADLNLDVLTAQEFQALKRKREPDSNKGEFGHVLVVGGSVGKAGAAAMAGLAALRSGAGLVTVACPKSVQPTIAAVAPELMTEPLDETAEGTVSLLALKKRDELLKGKSLVIIGPGLSRNEETSQFIRDFIGKSPGRHLVIDADGLNAFEGRIEELQPDVKAETAAYDRVRHFLVRVLTPHPGELSRLLGIETNKIQANRMGMALLAAKKSQCTVVLKGHRTVIASPSGYLWINCSGNPGMAKGGSGDVLSGVLGGTLAQNPHFMGMVGWKSNARAGQDIHKPELQGIFEWVARQEPLAEDIHALGKELEKSQDSALLEKGNAMCLQKVRQLTALLGPLHTARAVFLHGLAGDIARDLYGEESMIATDIINSLGHAFDLCERESHDKFVYIQR